MNETVIVPDQFIPMHVCAGAGAPAPTAALDYPVPDTLNDADDAVLRACDAICTAVLGRGLRTPFYAGAKDLAKATGLTQPQAHAALERLEGAGYVERLPLQPKYYGTPMRKLVLGLGGAEHPSVARGMAYVSMGGAGVSDDGYGHQEAVVPTMHVDAVRAGTMGCTEAMAGLTRLTRVKIKEV